jgi:uncharacterized protein
VLPIALLLSALVGVSLGLLGGGGSILMLPILRYGLGLEARPAIALSLLVVAATSAAALIPHARRGQVRWRLGAVFGLAGMAGAYPAGRLAAHVPEALLLLAFAVMMAATAVAMLRPRRAEQERPDRPRNVPWLKVAAEGLVVGAVTGLVGAGGGFLVVPALVLLGGMPMGPAIGTSLLVITMKSAAGFAGFAGHTPVTWSLAAAITGAAVAGCFAGSAASARISPATLRRGFGGFVLMMAFAVLAVELPRALGLALPRGVVAGIVVVGAAVALLATRVASRRGRAPRSGRARSARAPGEGPAAASRRIRPDLGMDRVTSDAGGHAR